MTPLPDFGAPDHSIRRLFQIGMRAQNSEQPRLARTAYAEILRQNPRLAEIYFHLARLELAEGHSNAALKHLTTARTLKPGEPEIWALTVDALKARNKPAALRKLLNEARTAGLPQSTIERLVYRAQSDGKSGVAQLGKIPPRAFQACVAQYRGGQLDFALQMAEQLAAQYPPAAPLETLIASIHTAKGEVDAAIRRFERAVSLDPNYAEARIMLGQVFLGTGQRDRAKQEFTAALRGVPNSPVANRFLGEINIAENQLINARRQLEIAHSGLPDDVAVCTFYGEVLLRLGQVQHGLEIVSACFSQTPNPPAALFWVYGALLAAANRDEEAIATHLQAISLFPDDDLNIIELGHLYQQLGRFEDAIGCYEDSFQRGVFSGNAVQNYAIVKKFSESTPTLHTLKEMFAKNDEARGTRAAFAFGLAKICEDIGELENAFDYLNTGNEALAERFPVESDSFLPESRMALASYAQGLPAQAGEESHAAPRVVFVSGMPRSGTTLAEQIVGSHSRVSPLGEVGIWQRRMLAEAQISDISGQPFTQEKWLEVASGMRRDYGALSNGTSVVTDKAIFSFQYIGHLLAAMPDARMIIVRRDPRDNCLSMYKNMFIEGTFRFTSDLRSLGRTYLKYLEILDFWRNELAGSFTEVYYEDIIADPETGARRLLDAAGLPWEDGCLNFQQGSRKVRTLSAFQARQPIFSSSVGAWRKFEDQLAPLIEILADGGALEDWPD